MALVLERVPATLQLSAVGLGIALIVVLPLGSLATPRFLARLAGSDNRAGRPEFPCLLAGHHAVLVFSKCLQELPSSGCSSNPHRPPDHRREWQSPFPRRLVCVCSNIRATKTPQGVQPPWGRIAHIGSSRAKLPMIEAARHTDRRPFCAPCLFILKHLCLCVGVASPPAAHGASWIETLRPLRVLRADDRH